MPCDPKYIGYNELSVLIGEKDPIAVSNVNTLGLPPKDCGSYLQSLTINSAAVSHDGVDGFGCTGSVTLIDYKNYVFHYLVTLYNDYAKQQGGDSPFVPITITIKCFTGERKFKGNISEWKWDFRGNIATIQLEWIALTPSTEIKKPFAPGTFTKPSALLKYVQDRLPKIQFPIKFNDGSKEMKGVDEIDNYIQFIDGYLTFNHECLPNTGNALIDVYIYVCNNVTTSDGKPVVGTISDDGTYYKVESAVATDNASCKDENSDTVASLVFVQNGNHAPYVSNKDLDNKIPIPLTSFSVELNLANVAISNNITKTKNGVFVIGNQCSGTAVNADKADINSKAAVNTSGDSMIISFGCYNVACFSCNNSNSRISIIVYDEDGDKVDYLTKNNLIVQSVSYDLSGPVIRADVKCTAEFGNVENTPDEATGISKTEASSDSSDSKQQ